MMHCYGTVTTGIKIISGGSLDTMTSLIHFSSVKYLFLLVKFIRQITPKTRAHEPKLALYISKNFISHCLTNKSENIFNFVSRSMWTPMSVTTKQHGNFNLFHFQYDWMWPVNSPISPDIVCWPAIISSSGPWCSAKIIEFWKFSLCDWISKLPLLIYFLSGWQLGGITVLHCLCALNPQSIIK